MHSALSLRVLHSAFHQNPFARLLRGHTRNGARQNPAVSQIYADQLLDVVCVVAFVVAGSACRRPDGRRVAVGVCGDCVGCVLLRCGMCVCLCVLRHHTQTKRIALIVRNMAVAVAVVLCAMGRRTVSSTSCIARCTATSIQCTSNTTSTSHPSL
jgi:hypothetical protein